jgi:octaprenyl-diphosphate synthase
MKLELVYRPIAACLARVDAEVAARTGVGVPVFSGGKRLRPALLLFSAHAFDGRSCPDAVLLAAAVEMVHTASLIHDDVIDTAKQRRQSTALHRRLGVKPAVILADLLFVQGLSMLESVRGSGLAHALIREVRTMCEGQWLEMKAARARRCTKETYQEIIDKKTAALFAFCCRTGGVLRNAPTDELTSLDMFGRGFGLAYQLLDDARDLSTDRPGLLEQLVIEWGGRPYLRRAAGKAAGACRAALAGLRDRTERRGLEHVLRITMEV